MNKPTKQVEKQLDEILALFATKLGVVALRRDYTPQFTEAKQAINALLHQREVEAREEEFYLAQGFFGRTDNLKAYQKRYYLNKNKRKQDQLSSSKQGGK